MSAKHVASTKIVSVNAIFLLVLAIFDNISRKEDDIAQRPIKYTSKTMVDVRRVIRTQKS